MAPNLSLLLGAFLLLFVAVQSKNHPKPPEKGFKFLQHLEGCHKGQTVKGLHELKRYLEKFGYLNYGTTNNHHHSKSTATISNLNHANDDVFDDILEYAVVGLQELRSVCSRAFQKWQDVSRFTFAEAPQGADRDIVIGFDRGNHGDGDQNAFDGRGQTSAHAFPPTRGWFHYDADEDWSSNPNTDQIDLESIAVHEIGHVLGLGHNEDLNAIMYAYLSYETIKRDLSANDIEGIRVLYSS
ncbi:metalloendoproteinase 2-MMP-like [Cornus florida]|uniref:metalloendoproteinase 2-MMP-like n=1 Tax=Cornus florida TaxID=4283 RepID=UPI00289FE9F5|nr:metalloendoproteinase 2-MMP-like [Cornus florida]